MKNIKTYISIIVFLYLLIIRYGAVSVFLPTHCTLYLPWWPYGPGPWIVLLVVLTPWGTELTVNWVIHMYYVTLTPHSN